MDLSQYGISNSGGTGAQVSIPGLDGIQSALSGIQSLIPMITIVSLASTVLILVLYIVHIIRRWKVDKAIIETHKEVQAIRVLLEEKKGSASATVAPAEIAPRDVSPSLPITE